MSKTGVRGEDIHTEDGIPWHQNHPEMGYPGLWLCFEVGAGEACPRTWPDPESPALLVLQTLMNAPSRTSVSLGPARTCLGCSAAPAMMVMNWTGVEATAQVQDVDGAVG